MTEPIPVATIVHAIPNRTRLRIPSRRGDTALLIGTGAGVQMGGLVLRY